MHEFRAVTGHCIDKMWRTFKYKSGRSAHAVWSFHFIPSRRRGALEEREWPSVTAQHTMPDQRMRRRRQWENEPIVVRSGAPTTSWRLRPIVNALLANRLARHQCACSSYSTTSYSKLIQCLASESLFLVQLWRCLTHPGKPIIKDQTTLLLVSSSSFLPFQFAACSRYKALARTIYIYIRFVS